MEEAGFLTVGPLQLPMKYVVPWMIFVMLVISCMICFMPWGMESRFTSIFFWFFLFFGWFVALPGTLGLMALISRSIAKEGDYFKVDMASRTLELCQLGRTIKASEIIAITLLTRWYRYQYVDGRGPWTKTCQTGVLVRTQDGRVELCPVLRQSQVPSSKSSQWADRLAGIFQVPVRQIALSKSETRELNDC